MKDPITSSQISLLTRGLSVQRFHTVPTISKETVGHHSALVAGFAYLIWPDKPQLLAHAIFHDVAEHVTGDIPSPGKRLFVDRTRLKAAEQDILDGVNLQLPSLTPADERCLKICDILAGMAACRHELMLGNHFIKESFDNYIDYLGEMDVTEPVVQHIAAELTSAPFPLG